ncbi:hypothetical protein V6Z12_D11G299900 [Gossypium hirsutum]
MLPHCLNVNCHFSEKRYRSLPWRNCSYHRLMLQGYGRTSCQMYLFTLMRS